MSMVACSDESFRTDPGGPGEMQGGTRAAGLTLSVTLHGLALLWLLVVGPYGTQGSLGGLRIVSVEVELIHEDTTASTPQRVAAVPQQEAAQLPSDPTPDGMAPITGPPLTDALETKLQALAQLHQPDTDTRIVENDTSVPNPSAADDDAAAGSRGVLSLKGLIRARVERRWNLDVAALGNNSYFVPIHVEMTSAGVVIKAEIMDTTRPADPVYRDIAVSARNAVLMSSPFSLPAGHYQGVIDMVLDLNPRDTLR